MAWAQDDIMRLLLALHRTDFPADVNVGRIMARLGWVPLEAKPRRRTRAIRARARRLHIFARTIELFDVEMLYELHYHMITLGKVFCAKLMPNCVSTSRRVRIRHAGRKMRRSTGRSLGAGFFTTTDDGAREATGRHRGHRQERTAFVDRAPKRR